MDKDQAKFLLESFRPDGADALDPAFTQALAMAMENRELGEWLAEQRAFDAAFADALARLPLPTHLREEVIDCLAHERGDFPQADDPTDAEIVGSLAALKPPSMLRERILQAMEQSIPEAEKSRFPWGRFVLPLAIAASVVLLFFLNRPDQPGTDFAAANKINPSIVKVSFVKTMSAPDFSLDLMKEDSQLLIAFLRDKQTPYPTSLPNGIAGLKALGCRDLEIEGVKGSLICFNLGEDKAAHLITFPIENIKGDLPLNSPHFFQDGEWASAQWQDGQRAYFLIRKSSEGTLKEFF